jgi:hypothetical protein
MEQEHDSNVLFSEKWTAWITECKLIGWTDDDLVRFIEEKYQFDKDTITLVVKQVGSSIIYETAFKQVQQFRKLESLVSVINELNGLSVKIKKVPRKRNISFDVTIQVYKA